MNFFMPFMPFMPFVSFVSFVSFVVQEFIERSCVHTK
jgi:hypothetical protein